MRDIEPLGVRVKGTPILGGAGGGRTDSKKREKIKHEKGSHNGKSMNPPETHQGYQGVTGEAVWASHPV